MNEHILKYSITILGIQLLLVSAAISQVYPFINYTPKNGLVNNRVKSIFQDNEGKLYFSTAGGLSVYDGSRFTNYTTRNGLRTSLINDILQLGDDSLMLVPNEESLYLLVHGKIRNWPTSDKFYPTVNKIIKANDGKYYALSDEGLFLFENNKFTRIDLLYKNVPLPAKNLYHASISGEYLFINTDVKAPVFQSPNVFFSYNILTHQVSVLDSQVVFYSVNTPANDILLSTHNGIYQVDKSKIKSGKISLIPVPEYYRIPRGASAECMYCDKQNNLWLCTSKGILKILFKGPASFFNDMNGLPVNQYYTLFQDRENIMWFGNDQTGVTKLVHSNLLYYSHLTADSYVVDVAGGPKSSELFLLHSGKGSFLTYSDHTDVHFNSRKQVFYDNILRNKNVIYATDRSLLYKLFFQKDNSFSDSLIYSTPENIPYRWMDTDRNGNILMLNTELTIILNNKKLIRVPLDFMGDQAFISRDDYLFVITRSGKMYQFKIHPDDTSGYIDLIKIYSKELNGIVSPRSLTIDHANNIWIGTRNDGLYCLSKNGQILYLKFHIQVVDGLTENFIQSLYCDKYNNIWACSPGGLDKIILKGNLFFIKNVTLSANMFLNVFKVHATETGDLWALATTGVVKTKTAPDSTNGYKPRIIFSKIAVNNLEQSSISDLVLSYWQNDLLFKVAAPTYIDETQTRFSFRLAKNGKGKWTDAGTTSEINYINLAPGSYNLTVKAKFLNGIYAEEEMIYPFMIKEPWWQTWWFRVVEVLGSVVLLGVLFRIYYLNKLQQQGIELNKKQAVERERTRIATDMHDDLGAGLSRIMYLSEMIKIKKNKGNLEDDDLNKIAGYSHEMISKMGEIVWALNEKNDSLDDLISYTRAYTMEYLNNNGLNCSFHILNQDLDMNVSGEIRRNIFLCVKEILHNIVKHAKATEVIVTFSANKALKLNIKDNGVGINQLQTRPFSNGVNNIKKRMKEINGYVNFKNSMGTTVELTVPLEV